MVQTTMEHLITQAVGDIVNSVSAMVSNQSAKEFESDLLLKIEEFHKNAKIRSELFYKKLVGSDNVKEYKIRRVKEQSFRIFVGLKIGDNISSQVGFSVLFW